MALNPADTACDMPDGGHHIAGDRNVIGPTRGTAGTDIFFAAVQMSRMPMVLSDPHLLDNPIIFCNRAFEQLTGYSQDELLGRNCRFLQGQDTDPAAVAEIRRALTTQEDVHLELVNYRKDGSKFWNALFLSPVIGADGTLVYYFASQLDVSRRRETEAAMVQTQRMDTLGSMASSLAHEFNNLMTVVIANLEQLGTEMDLERRAKNLARATWGAQRAVRLTGQMLSFARREIHDDQPIDVNKALLACDVILDQVAGPHSKVRLELADEPLLALVDPSQLELALINLIKNAADAVQVDSEIVISTRRHRLDNPEGAPAIEIAVTDAGSGMTPEVAARALEPFYTTKASGKGTGLGLSMVKGFVEQSNGKLELETATGTGTTIRMVFPFLTT